MLYIFLEILLIYLLLYFDSKRFKIIFIDENMELSFIGDFYFFSNLLVVGSRIWYERD